MHIIYVHVRVVYMIYNQVSLHCNIGVCRQVQYYDFENVKFYRNVI